jgi:CIC family chloride channel protein
MLRVRSRLFRLIVLLRAAARSDHVILSVLSVVVGLATGGSIILFREFIVLTQWQSYGAQASDAFFHGLVPWWRIMLVTTTGGLLVGLVLRYAMPGGRPQAVADVIAASALRGGTMSGRAGVMAAIVSALSLGAGASSGREGPAVHIGATLGGWLAGQLHLTRSVSRTLLGCGVAAAVAASFNAPLAGALFASEVVIGHYALRAFAPIVIASVTGTVVSQAWFGSFPAFKISHDGIASLWEFPAFVGLGIVAAIAATVFIRAIFLAEDLSKRISVPPFLRPAIGGVLLGLIALVYPQVLGVGYLVTGAALSEVLPLTLLVGICAAKIVATATTLGFSWGGGVFSPSLVIGATLGGAYGIIATYFFPELSSGYGVYAMIGMGAVAAAVLGAPISTTLIIFELTGDYEVTLAVMLAVVVASLVTQKLTGPSYFALQLERRGLMLRGGFERTLLRGIRVADVMATDGETVLPKAKLPEIRGKLQQSSAGELFVVSEDGTFLGTISMADLSESAFDHDFDDLINAMDVARPHPPMLGAEDTMDKGLQLIRETGEAHIAVVADADSMRFIGCLHERDAMHVYNRSLVEQRREERGE